MTTTQMLPLPGFRSEMRDIGGARLHAWVGGAPQGPPVVRNGLQSDRPEQQLGWHVVNVRDERHAHPRADGLVLQAQAVRMPAGPVAENERAGNCHQKRHRQDEQVGGSPHSSNIDGMAMLRCPSCAVENPDTASACISCAAPLSSPSMIATVAAAALSSSTTELCVCALAADRATY